MITSVTDRFNAVPDISRLSLREAVHLTNMNSGAEEIWLPGWTFSLTLTGENPNSSIDTSINDLDVAGGLVVRGIQNLTEIQWHPAVVDAIFSVIGDFDGDLDNDVIDFGEFADNFGLAGVFGLNGDFDLDGDVDIIDFGTFSDSFGIELIVLNVIGF